MPNTVERTIGDLRIVVQRDPCVGFARCVGVAEDAFQVDDGEMVTFVNPGRTESERLLQACEA